MAARLVLLFGALVASLTAPGCKFVGDKNSGEDASRGGAVPLELGVAADDRLSLKQGDNTDWKSFALDADSEVTVQIWWDDPTIKGSVTLRDQFGAKLASVSHEAGKRQETLGPLTAPAGQNFIEVFVSRGATVYTIQVDAKAAARAPSAPVRPDF
jgi:hypothetical protein